MPAALSQIRMWSTENLINAAHYLTTNADRWEDVFLQIRNESYALPWRGAGGDALRLRASADLPVVSGKADQLRRAAGIARNGASDISAAQRRVLYAVQDAQEAGFVVGEDLSVIDTRTGTSPAEQAARRAQAASFAADIRFRAELLEAADAKVAGQLAVAATGVGEIGFAPEHHEIQLVDFKHDGGPQPNPAPSPAPGLPPEGLRPPVDGNLTTGPASRPSEQAEGGMSLWDNKGGEWRYDPGADKWHNPHWDYNPHDRKFARWQNIQIGDLPPHTAEAAPRGGAPAPKSPPAPRSVPAPAPPVEAPTPPKPGPTPTPPKVGKGPMTGGGPTLPFGPQVIHPPHSVPHHFPILGEDEPWENPRDFE